MKWVECKSDIGKKWELKNGKVLLGTIFYKPSSRKFSLWFSTPVVAEKIHSIATRTFQYNSLEEAVKMFQEHYNNEIIPWARAVCDAAEKTWELPDASSEFS